MKRMNRRKFLQNSLTVSVGVLGSDLISNSSNIVRAADGVGAPVAVIAQGLTDTAVQLIWMAVSGADSYNIYRDGVLVWSQPGTPYVDSSLSTVTTYNYQVSAIGNGIESEKSAAISVTTQSTRDTSPPSQPGLITVSSLTSSSAKLSWKASTDNTRIVGYRILSDFGSGPLVQIATTDGGTSYTATNLRASRIYQFAVLALDQDGNLSPARTISFTTASSTDTTTPVAPANSGVVVTAFSSTRIDVVWGASSSSDVSGYQVFRNGSPVAEIYLPLRRYYSDNGLTPGTSYTYQISTIDSAGNVSAKTTAKSATTLASGSVKIVRGPYLQQTTATSTLVAWWTNIPAASTVKFGAGSLTQEVNDPVLTQQHVMLIGGLTAGTTYSYQVISGAVTSAITTFRTAASPGSTFTFAAVGDYGGGSSQETQVASNIASGGTQFVQTLGDNVYPDAQDPNFSTTYSDFDARFFNPWQTVIKQQPIYLLAGNKEYYGDGAYWRNFWLPNNERWYSYEWGDAHILVLDSEQPYVPGTPQYQFAQADLVACQARLWRIVIIHRPPYSSTASGSSTGVQTYLVPLFEQYKVHLVLSGNTHNYERTFPLVGGVPQTSRGVTYIVSGGGGNGLNSFTGGQPSWSAFRQATYEHVRITVSPSSLKIDAIKADTGTVFDSATISSERVPGGIGGTVTDADTGAPIVNATVEYSGGSTTTDTTGSYMLSNVTPTTYNLTASATGYASQTQTVTVVDGSTAQQNFVLSLLPSPGTVTGVVSDASGVGITGATVSYSGGNTLTDASGTYTLSNVAPGSYTITAKAQGYMDQSATVSITSGQTATQNFTLSPVPHTPIFQDGFESGSLSAWTSKAGLIVQSQQVHAGTYAAQGNTTNGNTYAKKTLPSSYNDGFARIYFNVVSSSSQVNLLRLRTAGDSSLGYVFVSSTGRLGLRNDVAGTTTTSTTSVGSGWHALELHMLINGSASTAEVWLDGAKVTALSMTTNLGTAAVGRLQIGDTTTGRTYNVLFDDVVFDTQPVGP